MTNAIRKYRKMRIQQYGKAIKEIKRIFFSLSRAEQIEALEIMEQSLQSSRNEVSV